MVTPEQRPVPLHVPVVCCVLEVGPSTHDAAWHDVPEA
jgi:hypothetical protein